MSGAADALAASPPPSLRDAVRAALQDPGFEPADVHARPLSNQGIRNADSLLLVEGAGTGDAGTRSWSLVLKVISNEDADRLPPDHLWYWKREVLAFESGFLDDIPAIRAPACYVIDEHEDATWIWMELVKDEVPGRWAEREFARAAEAAGRFAGSWLAAGRAPVAPWLGRDHARAWAEPLSPETAWASPLVARAFPPPLRARVTQHWDDRERLLDWLGRLPETFGHGDFHRRNLLVERRADGNEGIVAVDWAWCGRLPVGADLGMLLAMSTILGDLDPDDLGRIDDAVTDAYVAGLGEAGAPGHEGEARLASALWQLIYAGLTTPALTAFWTSDDMAARAEEAFGNEPAALAARWARTCEVGLARAESAAALAARVLG